MERPMIATIQSRVDIRLVTVSSVDNEGDDCQVCDDATARVQANVYLPVDDASHGEVKSCCLRCVVPIVREVSDAAFRILVEVAE
jgi:hypothetical protein